MGKYGNFNLGIFDKLWSEGKFIQSFVDKSAMLKTNYRFAFENFEIERQVRPVDKDGVASFTIESRALTPDGMADFKGALAHNTGIDKEGSMAYSGSIGTFGKALNPVTVMDREEMAKTIAMFGNESRLVLDYIEDLQTLKNYMDSRLSNMAGQLISTGKIIGRNGEDMAILYNQDAKIPTANKVNAGAKAWTDPTADILDYMHNIESAYRDRTGDEQPLKWQIPLSMWRNVFLTNTAIKAKIVEYRTLKEQPTSSGGTVLEEWYVEYINNLGLTSPIEIVKEGECQVGLDTRTDVNGWDVKYAVLRPRGYAGLIVHGDILKAVLAKKYTSKTIERTVAYLEGGIYALINSVKDTDGYPEFHTDMEACAVPALTCAPYITIVDSSTAD